MAVPNADIAQFGVTAIVPSFPGVRADIAQFGLTAIIQSAPAVKADIAQFGITAIVGGAVVDNPEGNVHWKQLKLGDDGRCGTGAQGQSTDGSAVPGHVPKWGGPDGVTLVDSGYGPTGNPGGGTWATQTGVQQEAYTYATDTGIANAYVVSLAPAPILAPGSEVVFYPGHTNTGNSTLAVNGAAATIRKGAGFALTGGEIVAGQICRVIYDGTSWQLQAGAGVTSVALSMPTDFTVTGSPASGPVASLAVTGGVTKSGIQQEAYTFAVDTGVANAYAVALSPAPSLVAGSCAVFKAAHANTGASTLSVNGSTPIAITKQGATALTGGEIAAGQIVFCVHDGTEWQLIGTTTSSGGGGGGGSLVLLEQHTASASTELDFTAWYSSAYDEYMIELVDMVPSGSMKLGFQMSTNGGTSYDTASNYQWSNYLSFNGGNANNSAVSDTALNLDNSAYTETINGSWNGTFRLFNPAGALYKVMTGQWGDYDSAPHLTAAMWTGLYKSTTAVNAFRLIASANNFTSGVVRVYGIAKTTSTGGGFTSGLVLPVRVTAVSTTLTTSDYCVVATAVATVTLPASPVAGQSYQIKNGISGTGSVTVSGGTIDGVSSLTLAPLASVSLIYDGTMWRQI